MKKAETQTVDRRIRKTKSSIRDSFMQLVTKKNFSQITVKEITEQADISRRTFYMHYNSIDDILDEMNEKLSENVVTLFSSTDFSKATIQDIKDLFSKLNDILNRNYSFYKRLASIHSYSFFINMLTDVLKDIIRDTIRQNFQVDSLVVFAYSEYFSAGIISLYVNWLKSDTQVSMDDLVEIAADITYGGIHSLIEK